MVRTTGLHPRDPGCRRASAEVSSSKTRSERRLQAAVLHHSLTSDLNLSGKVCFPFSGDGRCWRRRGLLLIPDRRLLCAAVAARMSVSSRSLPHAFRSVTFSETAHRRGDDRLFFRGCAATRDCEYLYHRKRPNPQHAGAVSDACQMKAAKAQNMHPPPLPVIPLKLHTFAWK